MKKKWVTKPRRPEIGRPSESFWSGHYKRQAVCQMTYKGWNNDSSIKAATFACVTVDDVNEAMRTYLFGLDLLWR